MSKHNDLLLKFPVPNLANRDFEKLIYRIVYLHKYDSSMKNGPPRKLLKKYSDHYPILCKQSIKYQNNFKYFDETYHLEMNEGLISSYDCRYFKGIDIKVCYLTCYGYLDDTLKYNSDIYQFFKENPLFILLISNRIPYSLKEIWYDFQDNCNPLIITGDRSKISPTFHLLHLFQRLESSKGYFFYSI
jgi:hypothetical protein